MSGNAREAGRSTLDRVLSLIDAIDSGDLTLTEIAERSQLPLTTASRILSALERWGGVERSTTRTYQIGVRLWEIGARASSASSLRDTAFPVMHRLLDSTRENVQLAILDKQSALVIERLTTAVAVPTITKVGRRLPLHASAVGKVLLAYAGPELLSQLCEQGLTRFTPYTQVMPGRLAASLANVRKDGCAVTREELTVGTVSVAAPITGPNGSVYAALGIVVRSRVDVGQHTSAVREAAGQISRALAAAAVTAPNPLTHRAMTLPASRTGQLR